MNEKVRALAASRIIASRQIGRRLGSKTARLTVFHDVEKICSDCLKEINQIYDKTQESFFVYFPRKVTCHRCHNLFSQGDLI
jgi:hypothetical protein